MEAFMNPSRLSERVWKASVLRARLLVMKLAKISPRNVKREMDPILR
jgi:hypothetical protein